MKKTIIAAAALLMSAGAFAADNLTVSDLATNKDSKAAFSKMVKGHKLPAWVSKGGTSTPAKTVKIGDTEYQVLSACKPHNCSAERVAVLWSEKSQTMSGLFSAVNEKSDKETLTWLNVGDALSIDGKTVLYSALSGSLENHPDAFNF
ncbi:Ivy family C-type lysozyme inhibitor [uncultured Pluralibacter sp.]|uniref:Ivy family C-type lysozyme inhibitor n=1 Tax=uncultured Pluralibacter sp. TaxID=1490864 RepID=UPI00262AA3C1|nr:Ivy family C-type lysozyme inhibitor [uncultured Pluralibacter sp.]